MTEHRVVLSRNAPLLQPLQQIGDLGYLHGGHVFKISVIIHVGADAQRDRLQLVRNVGIVLHEALPLAGNALRRTERIRSERPTTSIASPDTKCGADGMTLPFSESFMAVIMARFSTFPVLRTASGVVPN